MATDEKSHFPHTQTDVSSAVSNDGPAPTADDTVYDGTRQDVQVKSMDMSDDMRDEAVEVAQEAMGRFKVEKEIAQHIKRQFDERRGATWHCIVGRNFGSFVTHETRHFIYMYIGRSAVLLFKTQ